MARKIKYTDGPIGRVGDVVDFLQPPSQLVRKDENVKVTINLSKSSITFFKSIARENRVQYQKVIRNLLDSYTHAFNGEH